MSHRLDRETSGVLVCARDLPTERALKAQFEGRRVQKEYLAIVRGCVFEDQGTISLPMRHAEQGLHLLMETCNEGQGAQAETHFDVLERKKDKSLLRLRPHTGRQHQLRVHLSAKGHPIIGDKLYGPEGISPFFDYIDEGMTDTLRERLGHERHALHAHRLWIEHPGTGQNVEFVAPMPQDLLSLWER
ncbi:MAG: RluA family pseudouridine synthase [Myxococcales bacterium]|nr:MAG: RluA family pseudouridine synthase [Myxococcales bacterium]